MQIEEYPSTQAVRIGRPISFPLSSTKKISHVVESNKPYPTAGQNSLIPSPSKGLKFLSYSPLPNLEIIKLDSLLFL